MTSPQTCLYCGIPIVGRRDKRYCNNVCKSRDFREQGGSRTTVIINAAAPESPAARKTSRPRRASTIEPPEVSPAKSATLRAVDEVPEAKIQAPPTKPLTEQIAEGLASLSAQRQRRELDDEYVTLIENFLDNEGQLSTTAELRSLKMDAEDLASRYREHPLVKQGDELHRQRLKDIYVVRDAATEALAEAQAKPFWKEQRGGYQLPGKVRRKMRERLIA